MKRYIICFLGFIFASFLPSLVISSTSKPLLAKWAEQPLAEEGRIQQAQKRLNQAIDNPEYMLTHWIDLPSAPKGAIRSTKHFLHLREAILLALRYNPNIKNAELDRIIQRYHLRLAENEFELQYALAGSAIIEKSRYSNVGETTTKSTLFTPEVALKTRYGGQLSLNMDNNLAADGNYNPLLNFSIEQPLLRDFGKVVNETNLLNAKDNEWLNQLNLQQAVADKITEVMVRYRALVLSGNNLQNERRQLIEARKTFDINEKKIAAGQLEPTANIQQSYQIESLSLMVEQVENEFRIAAQDLLQAIGLDPDIKLAVPSDVVLKHLMIPNTEKAIAQGLAHNTQYLALKMLVRADQRAYLVAKNQQLWQLNVKANIQAGTFNDVDGNGGLASIYNGRSVIESAGITLTVPIHDLSQREALISAKVRLEKDRLNLLAAKQALVTQIKNTISTIQSQSKRYQLAKRQVLLATQSYELEKKKQEAGIASSLDVHNTQNQLLQAQNGLISAKISYLNALSALQRLLGTTLTSWHINLRYGG